jgi:hypothetical protein
MDCARSFARTAAWFAASRQRVPSPFHAIDTTPTTTGDNEAATSRRERALTAPHTVKQAALWSPSHPKHEGRQRARSDSRAAPPTHRPWPARPFQARDGRNPGRLARCLGSAAIHCSYLIPSASYCSSLGRLVRMTRRLSSNRSSVRGVAVMTPNRRRLEGPQLARPFDRQRLQPSYSGRAGPKAA